MRGLREELRGLREFQEGARRREREWEGRWESRGRDLEVSRHLIAVCWATGRVIRE